MSNWSDELKMAARAAGADLVGVADLAPFRAEEINLPSRIIGKYTRAVSVAVRLDSKIIDGIKGAPTPDYAQHYRTVNTRLDQITAELLNWIKSLGFNACAIPATEIVDEGKLLGSISHKAVARVAGLGWQGKSLLIVNPQYGPRIRLATLLTDLPLTPDKPLKTRCGTCDICAKACPASAIKNVRTQDRYATREDALDLGRCAEQMCRFESTPAIGVRICGICVQVCPFGRRRLDALVS